MTPTHQHVAVLVLDLDAMVESGNVVDVETEDGWTLRRYQTVRSDGPFICDNR